MIRLDRIVTRTGDAGDTALADGTRLAKDHPLLVAIGTVDEANAALGLAGTEPLPEDVAAALPSVLNDLFDLGGDLALPAGSRYADQAKRILPEHVARLETLVESSNARLTPLTSFILPGGSRAAALLHVARTVVRRAERSLVTLRGDAAYAPNPECLRYLNRLSDLCFIWARRANDDGRADMLWRPGASVGG